VYDIGIVQFMQTNARCLLWCMAKLQLLFFLMHHLVLVKFVYGEGGVQFLHTNAKCLFWCMVEVTKGLILEFNAQFPKQLVMGCHGNCLSLILIASRCKNDLSFTFGSP